MAENTSKEVTVEPPRKTGLIQFFQEVRRETSKITWPTWKETWLTTVMVFIMVVLMMGFFFVVDSLLGLGVRYLLGVA
jgi:preprotein translocase subunit SecE